tara:strand:+ start:100 stop:660 length:561 start_codon:yes stop_codon:yes gene_type:complete
MAQGPTNVNLIATFIHNNPGCRRVDLKRMLHKAATGEHTDCQSLLACKNQYFQRYGSRDNVYLDRLWYNERDKDGPKFPQGDCFPMRYSTNLTRKSSYQLTWQGSEKVFPKERLIRPFEEGSIVEWQWNSPFNKKHGWQAHMQGLVVERTELYGLWVLPIGVATREDGKLIHVSHQAFIRRIHDQT